MTNISPSSYDFDQETDNESWNFERLNDLRDTEMKERGDDFEVELRLIPATNYFDNDRIIVISDGRNSPLSTLPTSMTDEWWPLVTDCYAQDIFVEVNARIWTSPEMKEFYASVRIDLPSIEDAEQTVRDDNYLDDAESGKPYVFRTPPGFANELNDYLNPVWRKAHGMTDEQMEMEHQKTVERLERMRAEREKNSPYKASSAGASSNSGSPQVDAQRRSQAMAEYESSRKKGIVAWLLWLFLGVIGAHRFYLGNTGYAVAMLLLGWATLGIWPLLDGIICINRNLRTQNLALWERTALTYAVSPEPAPESAR